LAYRFGGPGSGGSRNALPRPRPTLFVQVLWFSASFLPEQPRRGLPSGRRQAVAGFCSLAFPLINAMPRVGLWFGHRIVTKGDERNRKVFEFLLLTTSEAETPLSPRHFVATFLRFFKDLPQTQDAAFCSLLSLRCTAGSLPATLHFSPARASM